MGSLIQIKMQLIEEGFMDNDQTKLTRPLHLCQIQCRTSNDKSRLSLKAKITIVSEIQTLTSVFELQFQSVVCGVSDNTGVRGDMVFSQAESQKDYFFLLK